MTVPRSPTVTCRRRSISQRLKISNLQGQASQPFATGKILAASLCRDSDSVLAVKKIDTLFTAFPVELRVEIFRHFCGDFCPIDKITEGPHLLLRICRAWKELVLQTPQLWTSFSLDFSQPLPRPTASEKILGGVKRWINRSRNLPISFIFHYPVLDATCTALLQSILPVSARWRDVTLHAPSASLLPFWAPTPNAFPALRSLRVETVGLSPFSVSHMGIDWAQLVKLDLFLITIPTLDECLHILREGVNLRLCSMNAACVLGTTDLERAILPKLEDLQLKLYSGDFASSPEDNFLVFLTALSLPNLRSLSMAWNVIRGLHQWSNFDKFSAFLEEARAHLETLCLVYLPFDAQQTIRCLGLVPCLKHLRITLSQAEGNHDLIDTEFLAALTLHPENTDLVPRLKSIRLECPGESLSNVALFRFIASRWRYQKPLTTGHLERVELLSPKRRAVYTPRRFRDLREGRLDVAASLKSAADILEVLRVYMEKETYDTICFMNGDFPPEIQSLLVFR